MVTQALDVEGSPDDEHEEDQTDLAQRFQVTEARLRKQRCRERGRQPSEERRSQNHAGHHFAYDCRLADPAEDRRCKTSRGEDDEDLQNQQKTSGY